MNLILFLLSFAIFLVLQVNTIQISFVSWNVNDNKKFSVYTNEIITKLLKLESDGPLPDLYAITFQENCIDCKDSHLIRLSLPFINALESVKSTKYGLLSIYATRDSDFCESVYCLSSSSLHGTTFIMVLVKSSVMASDVFVEKIDTCSDALFGNKEKGIALIGFKMENRKLCFGGLHLDVKNFKSRQKCFAKILNKIHSKCDILFFGGDFNTRPNAKSHPVSTYFDGGRNQSYLEEMKITDELSGSKPFSGDINLLDYILKKLDMKFIEPFDRAPDFQPTYSIKAALNCEDVPVCYVSDRFPSWTDRIIYSPPSKVKCSEYSSIPSLGYLSDHIPVYAICQV